MAISPTTYVTFKKNGVDVKKNPTVVNIVSGAAMNVQELPTGTVKITVPESPYSPIFYKTLTPDPQTLVATSPSTIIFQGGATLDVTVAPADADAIGGTLTVTIPDGDLSEFSVTYFGSGSPSSAVGKNGDFYFDISNGYIQYVKYADAWVQTTE
jgi:hypothetical protein